MLLKLVRSGKLQPSKLVTHRFALDAIMTAYDTIGNAGPEHALKVILTNPERNETHRLDFPNLLRSRPLRST